MNFLIVLGGFFMTGIVSSLHCMGMCGPILAGFSQVFGRSTVGAKRLDFACYHLGRIWTYALLGLMAGFAGAGLRHGSALMGYQRAAGAAIGAAVIFSGIALLGVVPGLKMEKLIHGCASGKLRGSQWFGALLTGRGAMPRLLLGAVMGFLPCGLVYAMLMLAAALATPLHAAAAMIAFGVGTLPSLTMVLAVSHVVPARLRVHGTRLAAVIVILTGSWMMARALLPHAHAGQQPHVHQESH